MRLRASDVILIVGFFGTLAALQFMWLAKQPHLLGTDAYYLVVQAQSVLNSGHLKIPDANPIPFFVAGLVRAGLPLELSCSLILVLIWELFAVGIFLEARTSQRSLYSES